MEAETFASLTLSAALLVRAESNPARSGSGRTLDPILALLDSDHDATLSAREIAAAPVTLTALDINNDEVRARGSCVNYRQLQSGAATALGGWVDFARTSDIDVGHESLHRS